MMEPLGMFIPKIWADMIVRNLYNRLRLADEIEQAAWAALPPEEKARIERKRKNRKHYLKKVAWAKAHAKKRR